MEQVPKFSLEIDLRCVDACEKLRERPSRDALNLAKARDQLLGLEFAEPRMCSVFTNRNSAA